jgi:hypothetical protein
MGHGLLAVREEDEHAAHSVNAKVRRREDRAIWFRLR